MKLFLFLLLAVVCASCNVSLDEPEPIVSPEEPVEPVEPQDSLPKWNWSDMTRKIYGEQDEMACYFYTEEICHFPYRVQEQQGHYTRFSKNQSLIVESVTDSTMTITLPQGWFDPSCLPGCTKKDKIAVPRIIPFADTKYGEDPKINFRIFNKDDHLYSRDVIGINHKLSFDNRADDAKMYAHLSNSWGNNLSSDIIIQHDSLLYALSYTMKCSACDIGKDFLTDPDLRINVVSRGKKTYYSLNSSQRTDDAERFINAYWESDLFDKLSDGAFTISEFFRIISDSKFLKKSDYYTNNIDSSYESMDRIMADKHVSYVFYDEQSTNYYPQEYRTILCDSGDECLFFVNPDLIFFPGVKYWFYLSDLNHWNWKTFYEDFRSYNGQLTPTPLYTPRQYDWMIEILSALSPYTASGIRMKYNIYTSNPYASVRKESLTFKFANDMIAKKFLKAYFSVLEDKETLAIAKKRIEDNSMLSNQQKEKLLLLIDNLSEIIDAGFNFDVSFNLEGDIQLSF